MKKNEDYMKRVVIGIKLWVLDMWNNERPLVNVCNVIIASDKIIQNI